ncbi:hypothetical protein ACOME3_001047 [Neoechinorhynchus agilis]
MSFNTADHEGGGVILFNGERIIIYHKHVKLAIKANPITDLFGPSEELSECSVYLTTHRVIAINEKQKKNPIVRSMSIPFTSIKDISVEQPMFSANYVSAVVQSESQNSQIFDIRLSFSRGGAIEFSKAFRMAVQIANSNAHSFFQAQPFYSMNVPNCTSAQGMNYVYVVPAGQFNWVPSNVFNDRPNANEIFVADNPPPYPGLADPPKYDEAVKKGSPPPYSENQEGPEKKRK